MHTRQLQFIEPDPTVHPKQPKLRTRTTQPITYATCHIRCTLPILTWQTLRQQQRLYGSTTDQNPRPFQHLQNLSTALSSLISRTPSPDIPAYIQPQVSRNPRVDKPAPGIPHPILLFDITPIQGHPPTAAADGPNSFHWPYIDPPTISQQPQTDSISTDAASHGSRHHSTPHLSHRRRPIFRSSSWHYKPLLHSPYSFTSTALLRFPTTPSMPNFCTLTAINLQQRTYIETPDTSPNPGAIRYSPLMTDHYLAVGTRAYLNVAPHPEAIYMSHSLWPTQLPTMLRHCALWLKHRYTAPPTHSLHHDSCTATSPFPWYQLLRYDTTQQMQLLHATWLSHAKSTSEPYQYDDSSFNWTPHSMQYSAPHPSQSPRSLHSDDYTTVLSSIPWYLLLLLNGPSHTLPTQPQATAHPPHPNPNTYLSVYCFLQPQPPPRPVIRDPTTNFTTAYLPALATKFREWNRIWHNHSYYPYRTTPQPTTSNKNLLCPPYHLCMFYQCGS